MKLACFIFLVLASFQSFSQDSSRKSTKYIVIVGLGAGGGQFIKGGGGGTAAIGLNKNNNRVLITFFSYSELQIFNAMDTYVYELSLSYHRSIPIGSCEIALGTGFSYNQHIIDTARFSGNTSFKTVTKTNTGIPVYASFGYREKRWMISLQYHYNFNSLNEFKGVTTNISFNF